MSEQETGVTEPAAGVQEPEGVASPGDTAQSADETKTVPLSVLKSMRDEMKTLKDQNKLYQTQAQNQPQPAQAPQAPQAPVDPLQGMQDDDIVTVADQKKIMSQTKAELQNNFVDLQSKYEALAFMASHPDFNEKKQLVINRAQTDPTFAANLKRELSGSPNAFATLYNYGSILVNTENKVQEKEGDFLSELDQILANQEKPGSPAQVGGDSAAIGGGSKYDNMDISTPDGLAAFEKQIAKVKGLHV